MKIKKISKLEVVLKTVERCNINCTYCYFFNGQDDSYKRHPKYISKKTINQICCFLKNGIYELHIDEIMIIFHGGEPLLQNKIEFDNMCTQFTKELSSEVKLSFAMQSNATLLTPEWIELLSLHKVGVGISLDGPKIYNDKYRIDHRGKGTYDRVINGLSLLNNAAEKGLIKPPGVLSVINPLVSAEVIYNHFVHELKFKFLDFLLPDFTYESFKDESVYEIGNYLCKLFQCWVKDDDSSIKIKIFNSIIFSLTTDHDQTDFFDNMQVITITSNGQVAPNDVLRNTKLWDPRLEPSVHNNSLSDIVNSDLFLFLKEQKINAPTPCQKCCWEKVCKGGNLINRFNDINKFNNPSLFCNDLKSFYSEVTTYLLSNGISFENINKNLALKDTSGFI